MEFISRGEAAQTPGKDCKCLFVEQEDLDSAALHHLLHPDLLLCPATLTQINHLALDCQVTVFFLVAH